MLPMIKTCNHFMVFCADFHKIWILAKEKGIDIPEFQNTMDGVIVGVIDAALAMENALVAAVSKGLGCCCIGYARTADPFKMAELLKLPEGVFVVCGLAIGVPREMPDLKPKQPVGSIIHRNAYSADSQLLDLLKGYDAEITEYNRTRSGTKTENDWCGHILDYYREALSYRILDYLRSQGFVPSR